MLVDAGWLNVGDILAKEGRADLAAEVRRFIEEMPPARTDKELVAAALLETTHRHKLERTLISDAPTTPA